MENNNIVTTRAGSKVLAETSVPTKATGFARFVKPIAVVLITTTTAVGSFFAGKKVGKEAEKKRKQEEDEQNFKANCEKFGVSYVEPTKEEVENA